jgi:hypothetical protein
MENIRRATGRFIVAFFCILALRLGKYEIV